LGRSLAIGVSDEGGLFTLEDTLLTQYADPRGIRKVYSDPMGRYLYLLFTSTVEVYLNPLAPTNLGRIELSGDVTGTLKTNLLRKLKVPFKNVGQITIAQLQADLVAEHIDHSNRSVRYNVPVTPGSTFELELTVVAKVGGEMPLRLVGQLIDESDLSTPFEIAFHVSSEG
jgi:hypothetical protein